MVATKAWILARGTYSVRQSSEPFNPTAGDLTFTRESPRDINMDNEAGKGELKSCQELLQNNEPLQDYLNVASLANLATVHETGGTWKARGEPTEIAIHVFAARFLNRSGRTKSCKFAWKQLGEFSFDSDVKKMSVVFEEQNNGQQWVFTKGAVERVIESCSQIVLDEEQGLVELTGKIQNAILDNMEAMASFGLRCLALASRPYDGKFQEGVEIDRNAVEKDLVFRGLVGLYDPPRPESEGAVRECHEAGITVHMLTGDHPGTAKAIAAQVGIIPLSMMEFPRDVVASMVMNADQFDKLSDSELGDLPLLPLVVARCAPQTKVRMIEALHRRQRLVAMTGDGVNDSPSLKHADVGIAMGETGSDVAKDVSDIILTDDNFASIINAIEEGRRMFYNIQRFVLHLLAQNIAQACILLIGLAFKDSRGLSVFPLAPVEILWVIMCTSGIPDMGLGFEAAPPDVMQRPPVSLKEGVFQAEILVDMLVYGLWVAALCLGAFAMVIWTFGDGNLGDSCITTYSSDCDTVFRARATAFTCLTWFSLFLAWEMTSLRQSFFRMQPGSKMYFTQWMHDVWRNQFLFWAIIAGFITIFPVLYLPVINHNVFLHTGISWEWGLVFVATLLFFMGVEAWKWAKRVFFRVRDARRHGPMQRKDAEALAFGEYMKRGRVDSSRSEFGFEKRGDV